MTLDEPLRDLATTLAGPDGRSLAAGPGRWHVLFGSRPRPLLMPAEDYQLQERCLGYFVRGRLKSFYAKALLRANALVPAARLLPVFSLPRAGRDALDCPLPSGAPAHTAIQIGTAGPYQKASMLLLSDAGEGLALAKMAMAPSADGMVAVEAAWLKALEPVGALADQVPRLLGEGAAPNGRRYLVTSLAPSTAATTSFTPAHAHFLRVLGGVRRERASFAMSPYYAHLTRSLGALEPVVAPEIAATLWASLRDCRAALAGWAGPFVIAQGDFAPWNIRIDATRVFVFDWEYARAGANALGDVLNFFMIPRALSRRPAGSRSVAAVLKRAEGIARELHPERRWKPRVVSALALAYLIEVLLCYSRASGRLDLRHPVMRHYWRLVQARERWMAA
ncbi:MAG TPA: phosphotransferase [Burkholderiales bacterium]|nr:phosphotransferase [Burkholderiales bacterium]